MALAPFCYNNNTIRTAGTTEHPLFCPNDVSDILGITNSRNKATKLCDVEKQVVSVETADGKVRLLTFVNEAGLYSVALSCNRLPDLRPVPLFLVRRVQQAKS